MANKKVTPDMIEKLKIMRANGMILTDIAELTGLSVGTVSNYTKEVGILPKSRQRNPFEPISKEMSKKIVKSRLPTAENRRIAEEIEDIEYFIENHEKGTRFEGPLDKIDLEKLQDIMDTPTGYKSPLSIREWVDYYLGGVENKFLKEPPHEWTELQLEIFDLWEKHKRLMVETFRKAGKTMDADAIIIYCVCENPDNNYAIVSETKSKAVKRVKHVGDMLLTNKRIIADYGFLPHISKFRGTRQSWKKEEITVKRKFHQTDPTVIAFSSATAEATGGHYDGIVYDDVWSRNLEINGAENKMKWFDWYDGEMEGCIDDNTWELFLLTRKGVNDLYRDLEDRQLYVVFRRPAVIKFPSKYEYIFEEIGGKKVLQDVKIYTKDWEISEPERFSIEYFLEKKFKMPESKWRSEYQLDPVAEKGVYFNWDDLRFIKTYDDYRKLVEQKHWGKYFRVIGFMDLAFGKSSRADYTALVIVGFYDHSYYLLEALIKRGATDTDLVEMLQEAYRLFPQLLRIIYIEDDLQQISTVERIKKKVPQINIQGFSSRDEMNKIKRQDSAKRTRLDGKLLRIDSQLGGIIESKKLIINENMRNFKEFKDEYKTFPDCKHYDIIDALGNAVSILTQKSAFIKIISGGSRRMW